MSYRNLVGHRYGLLVVVKDMGVSKDGHHRNWLMKCDCGNTCVRNTGGLSKKSSCGCEEKKHLEIMSKNNVTHGMTNTGLYRSFKGMKSRCYRKRLCPPKVLLTDKNVQNCLTMAFTPLTNRRSQAHAL